MSDTEEKKTTAEEQGKDEDELVDQQVFNQGNDLIQEGHEAEFMCYNQKNRGGHITYTCKGSDEQGLWEGDRRFSEFFKLLEKLKDAWPGIPIPQLPPKKAIGNKDVQFINERRFYLERFLKKISAFKFILNCPEFQIFSRPPQG
jgi:hypothetical protein